jgi:hypothetical protein
MKLCCNILIVCCCLMFMFVSCNSERAETLRMVKNGQEKQYSFPKLHRNIWAKSFFEVL